MYNDNMYITQKLLRYLVKLYHVYLIYTGMYKIEAMIFQHLYWPDLIKYVQKEVSNGDNFQRKNAQQINQVNLHLS